MEEIEQASAVSRVHQLLCAVFDCSLDLAGNIFIRGRVREFPLRATIVRRGDHISALYVVIAGRAHAIVYSLDGQIVLLHEYCPGDFFGVVVGSPGTELEFAL